MSPEQIAEATEAMHRVGLDESRRYPFPVKFCGRCGGGGRYSWNAMHGDTCYGCNGSGVVPANKAVGQIIAEYNAELRRQRQPSVADLKVGDRVVAGFKYRKDAGDEWATITAIDVTDEACGWTGADRVPVSFYTNVTLDDGTTHRLSSQVVRRYFDATALKAAAAAQADEAVKALARRQVRDRLAREAGELTQSEKQAQKRAEVRKAAAETAAADAEAQYGAHGTEARAADDGFGGCRCDQCVKVAPHGTIARFGQDCACLDCQDAAVASDGWTIHESLVLIDVATGEATDARLVDTRYGTKWVLDTADGTVWVPMSPARRTTQTKHGYVQAWVEALCEVCGSRQKTWLKTVRPVASPLFDYYGEPIEHPEG